MSTRYLLQSVITKPAFYNCDSNEAITCKEKKRTQLEKKLRRKLSFWIESHIWIVNNEKIKNVSMEQKRVEKL